MKSTRVCALWRGLVLPVMALVSVCWLLPGEAVSQQQPKDKDKEKRPAPPTEMKVFQVKHVSARNLASTILQIWGNQGGFRATIDDRSNSIIVVAAPQDIALVETLINKIEDATPTTSNSGDSVRVFPLNFTRANDGLTQALRLILPDGNYQVDALRNMVIVSGDQNAFEKAQRFLQEIDAPKNKQRVPEFQVRLVWLASGFKARKPPEDMKAVVAELAKMGIEEPSLVTQTLVSAMPDTQFRMEGLTGAPLYRLSVSGKLQGTPGELTNRLQISIIATQDTPGPPGSNQIGRLETEITTLPGHYVVLGRPPTATSTSVFVVQILLKK